MGLSERTPSKYASLKKVPKCPSRLRMEIFLAAERTHLRRPEWTVIEGWVSSYDIRMKEARETNHCSVCLLSQEVLASLSWSCSLVTAAVVTRPQPETETFLTAGQS